MNVHLKLIVALALGFLGLTLSVGSAPAASLVLDEDFRPPLFAEPIPAQRTLLLPDGKFLVFYNTDTLTDQRTGAITRYLPDGALDNSFTFSRDYKVISAAAPTANGQLIIAAIQFTYGSGFGTEQVLRLNEDGSIDSTYNVSLVHPEPYTTVWAITIQQDGKILVAGSFSTFAGTARQDIVRLLDDGTLDSSFTSPQFENGYYYGIYPKPFLLADGKILIAGDFRTVDGVAVPGVAQLNSDGSLDPSFLPSGFTRYSSSTPNRGVVAQTDGKVLVAGRLRIGSGMPLRRVPLVRLNADGSLDFSYVSNPQFSSSDIARDLILQPDGKAVAAITSSVIRLDTTGLIDSTFTPPYFLDTSYNPFGNAGTSTTVNLQPDGRMIVGGIFTDVNPPDEPDGSHFGVVRLNSDGTLDSTFITSHRTGLEDFPSSFARLSDGSVLTAFRTQSIKHDPAMHYNLGRLLPSGSLDADFSLSSSDPGGILSMGFVANDFIQLLDGEFFVFDRFQCCLRNRGRRVTAAGENSSLTESKTCHFN